MEAETKCQDEWQDRGDGDLQEYVELLEYLQKKEENMEKAMGDLMGKTSFPAPAQVVQQQRLSLFLWLSAPVRLLLAFVARYFISSRPELQQLEGQVAQTEDETSKTDVIGAIEKVWIKIEKHCAEFMAWKQDDMEKMKVVHQDIRKFKEATEEQVMIQQLGKKEAERPETMQLEVVEEQLMKHLVARRRGCTYWLRMLCVVLVSLQLFFGFVLASMVLYASYYDPEFFYRLLLASLPEEIYRRLAYLLGNMLPVRAEELLPF